MAGSRILVVDDDDDIRGLLRTLLERAGHEVSDASDGHEGLRELYAGSPDLVILDVAMPGLDGWEALERIRAVSDVPVLMLTARDGSSNASAASRAERTTTWSSRSDARSSSHESTCSCAVHAAAERRTRTPTPGSASPSRSAPCDTTTARSP